MAPCTSNMIVGDREAERRGAARGFRDVGDARVRRAVHRAQHGRAAIDAAVHPPFESETRERVVVIEPVVVADDRRVDRAGHRHRARPRVAALAVVDHELARLAELERAVAVERGADRLRIDIGHPQRGLRIEAAPFGARGARRRLAPRHGERGADRSARLRRDHEVVARRTPRRSRSPAR